MIKMKVIQRLKYVRCFEVTLEHLIVADQIPDFPCCGLVYERFY